MLKMKTAVLATMLSALALPAPAQIKDETFFKELDTNGDGIVDRQEFILQKGIIFYMLDANHDLKIEQNETKLSPDVFRQYAGEDGTIDGLELFNLPAASFGAFDQNGDQQISPDEFRRQLANLRAGRKTAEER